MGCDWNRVTLGRTGIAVTPLGLGSSFGVGGRDVERAFERGLNYLYWGTTRTDAFGAGLRAVARKDRARLCLVVQSYTRAAALMRPSLERALRAVGTDYADVLALGWWNAPPPERIIEAAVRLRDAGKARAILVSCHHRPTFEAFIRDGRYGAIMVRYNAAHPGAEREVFPLLDTPPAPLGRPGVVAYTATRWGHLLDPALTPPGEKTPRSTDCYRFALSHPDVNVVLAGPADGAQLDDAMAALDRGPMSAEEVAWMKRVGAHVRERAAAAGKRRLNPIELLDRAQRWFAPSSPTR